MAKKKNQIEAYLLHGAENSLKGPRFDSQSPHEKSLQTQGK